MPCHACQAENPPDALFCMQCGERLTAVCAGCGAANPPAAKFCTKCGYALSAGPAEPIVAAAAGPPPSAPSQPPAPPSGPSLPGALAGGRYQIQRFLGEGALKKVYLAHDSRLDRDVALAVVKTQGLDADGKVRVRREAQAMGRLGDHPHIVTVHDILEEGDGLYIVSQYMAGGDLQDVLQQAEDHRLPADAALRVGDQIAQALEHAHTRQIIHRDLKPGNIWLTGEAPAGAGAPEPESDGGGHIGTAKLGDFGLAVALDQSRLTQQGMIVGTAAYLSPEQAVGGLVDDRTDLYALGCVLYEMVTGRPPFQGDDAVSVISQHLNTTPIVPSWHNPAISPALEELIMHLLSKSADDRPATAGAVRQRLASIAAAGATVSSPALQMPNAPAAGAFRQSWGRFVGREQEMAQCKARVDTALSGRGSVLMLVGEPGIGKTRTANEVATYAKMRGAQVLWGRCYEGEGAPAYWPWVQIIRDHTFEADPDALRSDMGSGGAAIAQVVSDIRDRLPDLPEPPHLEPEQARFRLFDSLTTFFRNAGRRQPTVLILDDLHWADKSSLLLLQFLARQLAGMRLMVVGTYRDVELDRKHPLAQVLSDLRRERLYERVLLRGFSVEEVAMLLEAVSQQDMDAAGRALAGAIHRETEGNPFFCEEVILHLVESGGVTRDAAGRWTGRPLEELGIPEGIREVIGRRLTRLSEECNALLTIAAVIGRDFDRRVLEYVSGTGGNDLLQRIEEAQEHGLIGEAPGAGAGRHRFTHALIRETLYDELPTPRRVRLHRQVGEVLETLHADAPEQYLPALAYHFAEGAQGGGDVDKAIDFACRAAERATAQLAFDDAVDHYQRALQTLEFQEPVDEPRQAGLLHRLGEALWSAGDSGRAEEVLFRCIELARRIPAPTTVVDAIRWLGIIRATYGVPDTELTPVIEETLERLPPEELGRRATLLAHRSIQLVYRGVGNAERRAMAAEAVAAAEQADDAAALCYALFSSAFIFGPPPAEYVHFMHRMVEVARAAQLPNWECWGLFLRTHCELELARRDDAENTLRELEQTAETCRLPVARWHATLLGVVFAILDGRFDDAERLNGEALEWGQQVNTTNAMQYFGAARGIYHDLLGRLEDIVDEAEASLALYPEVPGYRLFAARTKLCAGDEAYAREEFERLAAEGLDQLPLDFGLLLNYQWLAELAFTFDDRTLMREVYERWLRFADRIYMVGWGCACMGSPELWFGRLAAALEEWETAEKHFQTALQVNEQMRARPLVAMTQLAYAQILRRRGPGDAAKALDLANTALRAAQDMGMVGVVRDALDLKLQAQGVDPGDLSTSIHAVIRSVQRKSTALAPRAGADGTVTLMFSDMVGFTKMTERLGDAAAHEIIKQHHAIVRTNVARHRGEELELQGDGFLLAFASPVAAVQCAVALQRNFAARNAGDPGEEVHVRIGLHTGEAIRDADKFFGKTVILASRVASQADGDEILASGDTKAATESAAGAFAFDEGRAVQLKGLADKYLLHRVEWRGKGAPAGSLS